MIHDVRLVELVDAQGEIIVVLPLPESWLWPQVVEWTPPDKSAVYRQHFLPLVPGRRTSSTGAQVGTYIAVPCWVVPN